MADQLRFCQEGQHFVHVSKMWVGRRECLDCEEAKQRMLMELGLISSDSLYASQEEKIWRYARQNGHKIDRLID